jgi:ParB-like chromosome segregation protein Spo0J
MIVDGERRYRGAVKAGPRRTSRRRSPTRPWTRARASAPGRDSNEGKRLKPMEEARTYKRIMAAKGWSIQQLADHLGKSKSTVSDRVAWPTRRRRSSRCSRMARSAPPRAPPALSPKGRSILGARGLRSSSSTC